MIYRVRQACADCMRRFSFMSNNRPADPARCPDCQRGAKRKAAKS